MSGDGADILVPGAPGQDLVSYDEDCRGDDLVFAHGVAPLGSKQLAALRVRSI
jgi:hypothetical protein